MINMDPPVFFHQLLNWQLELFGHKAIFYLVFLGSYCQTAKCKNPLQLILKLEHKGSFKIVLKVL